MYYYISKSRKSTQNLFCKMSEDNVLVTRSLSAPFLKGDKVSKMGEYEIFYKNGVKGGR